MSPSAEQLEKRIGRKLKTGDVLRTDDKSFEVLEPNVPAGEGHFSGGGSIDAPTVKVRELTPQGPGNTTAYILRNDRRAWTNIVKKGVRTDIPWWKKLF